MTRSRGGLIGQKGLGRIGTGVKGPSPATHVQKGGRMIVLQIKK